MEDELKFFKMEDNLKNVKINDNQKVEDDLRKFKKGSK